jgi:hypothetical protein
MLPLKVLSTMKTKLIASKRLLITITKKLKNIAMTLKKMQSIGSLVQQRKMGLKLVNTKQLQALKKSH